MSNRTVAIRDGAYSNFDTSKVVEGLNPIQQLRVYTLKPFSKDVLLIRHCS